MSIEYNLKESVFSILENIELNFSNIEYNQIDKIVEFVYTNIIEFKDDIDISDIYNLIIEYKNQYVNDTDNNDTDDDDTNNNDTDDNTDDDNLENNLSIINEKINNISELENELMDAYNDIKKLKKSILDEKIVKQVKYLLTLPQPVQRSPEWFKMREGKVTASDIGAILGMSKYNNYKSVLLKKLGHGKKYCDNIFTRHGKCFEDVACKIYENRNNIKVFEYGLIIHPKIDFIGASPDGICENGIMLEIKCPYTRKITGNVLDVKTKMYWAQMQIQLEVCDLEECDFLECDLREYENEEEYDKDIYSSELYDINELNKTLKVPYDRINSLGLEKGVLGKIYNQEVNDYIYIYPKINTSKSEQKSEILILKDELLNKNNKLVYIGEVYWKLKLLSCVRVKRDRNWFNKSLLILEKFINELRYRQKNGFDDLLPKKKKVIKININNNHMNNNIDCLINSSDNNIECLINSD